MARRDKKSGQLQSTSKYSRNDTAARYTSKRKKRGRHKVLRNVFIVIVVVLLGGVGAAWAYINSIDNRLSEGVDSNLLSNLSEAESGEPF